MENKVIYYCSVCGNTYGADLGSYPSCPNCRSQLIQTSTSRDKWRQMSDEEKEYLKTNWERKASQMMKEQKVQKNNLLDKYHKHMITSGYNFEGYRIVKYLGVVSGEVVIGTGFFAGLEASISDTFGVETTSYSSKLQQARDVAKARALERSSELGGNALIGVDIDYVNFKYDQMGVIYNGTSVVIEKIEE